VIILTSPEAVQGNASRADALRGAGATVQPVDGQIATALRSLRELDVQSLLIEGGAALHAALWDEDLVDYVQLYVTPLWLGPDAVPLLAGRDFSSASLVERRVEQLGPDVLIEGYVHRPH
jgi:diaminohydroxyphosphoribosylaminopyrimidine deaminase/5-amino-6-(5-phosphoribosylamino)uracil reductase